MTTLTISLPESMKEYVENQVQSGGYGNVSEYFRSLVREAQQKAVDRRLEQLLLEGLESEAMPVTPQFWNDLRAEAASRLENARRRDEKSEA
jgi:antitoxin ParD1/3/4